MTLFSHYLAYCSLISLLVGSCSFPAARTEADSTDSFPSSLELPNYGNGEDIICYEGFTVSYNHSTLIPNWVAYQLTADELDGYYNNKSSIFSRDPNLKGRQASREDYSHSGWDKGHMCPKADLRWSEKAYWQSHYFPNICPQNHNLNGGDWNSLEKSVRRWAKRYGCVWVVCGPVIDSCRYGTIGDAMVQVPDAFFKAVLVHDGFSFHAVAFVMPNRSGHQSLRRYACTVDQLESILDRNLFPALDDDVEASVEASSNWKAFGF